MAKVEQRHTVDAVKLLESALYPIDAANGVALIAQALADAEERGATRAAEGQPAPPDSEGS